MGQAIPEAVRKAYARQQAEVRNIDAAEDEPCSEAEQLADDKAAEQPPEEGKRYNLCKRKAKTEATEEFLEQRKEPVKRGKGKARRKAVALGTRPAGAEKSAVVTIVGHRNENADDIFDVELWAIFNDNTVGWVKLRDFFYDPDGGDNYGILDVALTYLKALKKTCGKLCSAKIKNELLSLSASLRQCSECGDVKRHRHSQRFDLFQHRHVSR